MAGGTGMVGTVFVGVMPSARGFQKALATQIRAEMGAAGIVGKEMNRAGRKVSGDFGRGLAAGAGANAFSNMGTKGAREAGDAFEKEQRRRGPLFGADQRMERLSRRNLVRSGRRSGQTFAQSFGKSLKSTGRSLSFTASGAAAVALGGAALLSANFESALSSAIAIAEPEELMGKAGEDGAATYARRFNTEIGKKFRETAFEVGKETIFSNKEAAQGLESLVRGGLDATTAYESLMTVANLAAAGQIEFADAANIAVSALNTFSDVKEGGIEKAGNQIAIAATKSQATVDDLGLSLQYAGSFAAEADQTFQDTLAAASLLGKRGIVGSKAGTRMLNFYEGLRGKSGVAEKAISDLGLEFRAQDGSLKGFVDTSKEMQRVFGEMGKEKKSQNLKDIFGIRGRPLANFMINTPLKELKRLYREIGQANDDALKDLAHAQLGPVARAFELMKGEWETAITRIGKAFEPTTLKLIQWFERIAEGINKMSKEDLEGFTGNVKKLAGALAAIALIGPGFWLGGAALSGLDKLRRGLIRAVDAALELGPALRTGAIRRAPLPVALPTGSPVLAPVPAGISRKRKRALQRLLEKEGLYIDSQRKVLFTKAAKEGGDNYLPLPGGLSEKTKGRLDGFFKKVNPAKWAGGWFRSAAGIGKVGKALLALTGIGTVVTAAITGITEAFERSSRAADGGITADLDRGLSSITGLAEDASVAISGVGESLVGIAETTGLDELWGKFQSFTAWLAESWVSAWADAMGSVADFVTTLGDNLYKTFSGIQRALIAMKIAAASIPIIGGGEEAMAEALGEWAALDHQDALHNAEIAQREYGKTVEETTTALGRQVEVVLEKNAAYGKTRKSLKDQGLLETAVQTKQFVLHGNPRRQAELALNKSFKGKALKVTVPIKITSGEVAGVKTFKKGSATGLMPILLGEGDNQRTVHIRAITTSQYDGLAPNEQEYFREAIIGGKTVHVEVKTKMTPVEGTGKFDSDGNLIGGEYEITPVLKDPGNLPKVKLKGELTEIDTGTGVAGPDIAGQAMRNWEAAKNAAQQGEGIEIKGDFEQVETKLKALTKDQTVNVDAEVGPELKSVTEDIKKLSQSDGVTISVTAPGAGAVAAKLQRIRTMTAVPFITGVFIQTKGVDHAIAILSLLRIMIQGVDATRANPVVDLKDNATEKAQAIQKKIDSIKQNAVPTVTVDASGAIAALGAVLGLLSAINGFTATATININTNRTTTTKTVDGDAEVRSVGTMGARSAGTMGARSTAETGTAGVATTSTAAAASTSSNPLTGGLSGLGRKLSNYKKLLRALKKAMRKLRGSGVNEINKTSRAFDKSIKKFDKAFKGDDKKAKKAHAKRVRVLERSNKKFKKAADKRKGVLEDINEDTKQYLAAQERSFKLASRGTSAAVLAGVKDLEDTFTLANLNARQKRYLRAVTLNDRKALKARAQDLLKFENAKEFRDQLTDTIKGSVDWGTYVNADDLTRELNRTTKYMSEYQNNLRLLRQRGVTKEVVEQLAKGDPARARLLANNLANATSGEISALNTAFKSFTAQAAATGDTAAGAAFAEIGKGAILGFAKGMAVEEKRIRGKIQRITNRIVRTVRRTLGIKSPSTVFAEIGKQMMQGLVVGVTLESEKVRRAVVEATAQGVPALPPGGGSVGSVGAGAVGGGSTVNVYPSAGMSEAELARKVVREMSWAS